MNTIKFPQAVIDAEAELNNLRAEYEALENKLLPAAEKYRKLVDQFAVDTLKNADDKLAVIFNPQFSESGIEYFNASNQFLWHNYRVRTSGRNPLTNQQVPSVTFYKGSDGAHNANMIRFIEDVLPYMIPIAKGMKDIYERDIDSNLEGFCFFDTTEHGLSENAVISLYISHDKKVMVSTTRYSITHYSKVMDFNEGIDYFIENHYYKDWSEHAFDHDESDY